MHYICGHLVISANVRQKLFMFLHIYFTNPEQSGFLRRAAAPACDRGPRRRFCSVIRGPSQIRRVIRFVVKSVILKEKEVKANPLSAACSAVRC